LGTVAPAGGPATQFRPSGNVSPSADDRLVTQSLQRAGEILGVRLIDHIIFSPRGRVSW
jgi:DNA repair protein RadC